MSFHASRVRWQGSEGRGEEACLRVMSPWRLLVSPAEDCLGVLIKITSGSSHMLILDALKDDANTSACSWGGGASFVFDCVGGMCVFVVRGCACVSASPCFCERNCNSCWGGGKDSRGEPTLRSVVSVVWS